MSADNALVGLDLNLGEGSIAAKITRAGQARALKDFAAEIDRIARADLEAEAHHDSAQAGGGGWTRKVDGVQAVLTDPQPKPHVTDSAAFEQWWVEAGLEHETVERVEVVDHAKAAAALTWRERNRDDPRPVDLTGLLDGLEDACKVVTDTVLPEKPLDRLLDTGRAVASDAGLIDTQTGEAVPGVECTRQNAQLRVTPDKQAKARNRAIVASYFGLPAELPEGGAA